MTQEHFDPTSAANAQPSPAAQFQFRFERFSAFVEEYTSTISLEGMFLKTREPRPVGTVVAFDIRLADGFQLIHGQGEVVWMRPDGLGEEQPGGMGIRFQALSDKGRELILKILDEHLKAGGRPFEVSDVPPGGVSQPGQSGAGTALGGLDFDAPWGAKLPDVPSEFLDEGGAEELHESASRSAAPASSVVPEEQAPAPPLDDVFALPAAEGPVASPQDVFAISSDDASMEALEDRDFGATSGPAFELEAVADFDAGMEELGDADGTPALAGQQSLPGLEPLEPAAAEVSPESADAADWQIQPAAEFDEQPTLVGVGQNQAALLGDEEPTLMSLHSAGAAASPPPLDFPLPEDLPSFGQEEEGAGSAEFSELEPESPFAAETSPEPSDYASLTNEWTPASQEAQPADPFLATEPVLEELADQGAQSWDAPEPTPAFATDAAPVDPFATDALEVGSYSGDSAEADPFATGASSAPDSFAAPDSFSAPDSSAVEQESEAVFGRAEESPWSVSRNTADALAAAPGVEFAPAGDDADDEFQPFEPSTTDMDSSSSGVIEGGLVGPFQFEDYELDDKVGEGKSGSVWKRFRRPLLGLAAVALLLAVVLVARGPLMELLGGGAAEPIGPRTEAPPRGSEGSPSPQQSLDLSQEPESEAGAGATAASVATSTGSGSEELESPPENTFSPPPPPPAQVEPEMVEAETTPAAAPSFAGTPSLAEPDLAGAAADLSATGSSSQAPTRLGAAEAMVEISTRRERGGTLVVMTLDGMLDPRAVMVDVMAWDPDSEKLVLHGIREPYYPQNLLVNSTELVEIRTGHHPGAELWIVFDFASTEFHLEAPQVEGRRLEILVR